jgi:hypothetical protein
MQQKNIMALLGQEEEIYGTANGMIAGCGTQTAGL